MMWKPQILAAIVALLILGGLAIFFAPDYIEGIAGGCVTGIGMLGIKLLEK